MPCNYKDYPKNWKEIVKMELIRAGNRCEMCGVPNGSKIVWNEHGRWAIEVDGDFRITSKVVLTTHHIDGDKTNNKYPNLLVCCQKHHLRLDLGKHMKNAKETRRLNKDGKK
jgi:hypothetical protein